MEARRAAPQGHRQLPDLPTVYAFLAPARHDAVQELANLDPADPGHLRQPASYTALVWFLNKSNGRSVLHEGQSRKAHGTLGQVAFHDARGRVGAGDRI